MKRERCISFIFGVIMVITIGLALMVGTRFLNGTVIWQAVHGRQPAALNLLLNYRLPRIVASLIGGSVLATAGALSQAVFRNSLADPSILGIASAGDLLIVVGSLILPGFVGEKLILALLGGTIAFGLLMNRKTLSRPYQLIIVGVALNLTFVGLQQVITHGVTIGTVQGFNGLTWPSVWQLLITGGVGLGVALILAPWANHLKLPDEQLATMGVSAKLMRVSLLGLIVYLSASVTAVVGVLPFVGIIVPNVARRLVGSDYLTLIPASIFGGAWLMLVVDTIGRLIVLPSELSAATLLTVLGGPFLVFWVQRRDQIGVRSH